jgi:hypothetical protein
MGWGLGPVVIGSQTIGGISASNCGLGNRTDAETASGEYGARARSIVAQSPSAGFTTRDVLVALTACGPLGCSLATTPLYLWSRQVGSDGKILATAVHHRYTCRQGLLYPTRLSCRHRGDGELTYATALVYDGSNWPVVLTKSLALPAGVADNKYTLSTAAIAGLGASDVTDVDVDFGVRVATEGSQSETVDRVAFLEQVIPRITLKGVNPLWFDTLGPHGTAVSAGSVTLVKKLDGGIFDDHTLVLTASGIAYCSQPYSAGRGGSVTCDLVLDVKWDGANAPIVVSST